MKISHKNIDRAEAVAGRDEDIGAAAEGLNFAVPRRTFKQAQSE